VQGEVDKRRSPASRIVRRRILKWFGVVACVAISAAWLTSTRHAWGHSFNGWRVESFGGIIVILGYGDRPEFRTSGSYILANLRQPGLEWPTFSDHRFGILYATMPYWLTFLIAAVPTVLIWRKDARRHRPGCCPDCGYNLTGCVSGVCSECGVKCTPPPVPIQPTV
jgi:hypothetical protein